MTQTIDREEDRWLVRLGGELTLASAAELKSLLLEWLASGTNLELDLELLSEIDITTMQLLWAAGREAARAGVGMVSRLSRALVSAARDAGFEPFPGTAVQGITNG